MAQAKTSLHSRTGHGFIEGTLHGALLQFDLPEEVRQQRKDESWVRSSGRSSKTLVKHRDLRIVLISMKSGTRMHEHKAMARISVQTIAGHVRIHLPEGIVDLPTGSLLVLDQCVPHDVEALEDSAFLLTLSWPPEAEINECRSHEKKEGTP